MYVTIATDNRFDFRDGIPSLDDLRDVVGGDVEAIGLSKDGEDAVLWLNEEGKLNRLPQNDLANDLAHRFSGIQDGDYIVGPCVLTGGPDGDGNTTGLPQSWVEYMKQAEASIAEPA